MDTVDLANVFLLINLPEDHPATTLSHNASFRVHDKEIVDEEAATDSRESTPFARVRRTWLELTLTRKPFDPLAGWVFGSNEETCDLLLDKGSRRGVSGRHFSINYDWDSRSVILTNISRHGTTLTSESIGFEGRTITGNQTWRLRQDERTTVDTGRTHISIDVPRRGLCQSEYEANSEAYHCEVLQAVPQLNQLKFHGPATETPAIASAARYSLQEKIGSGAFGTVYKAFDRYSNQVYAAKTISLDCFPEFEILPKLAHDHIVTFIDAFREPEPTIVVYTLARQPGDHFET